MFTSPNFTLPMQLHWRLFYVVLLSSLLCLVIYHNSLAASKEQAKEYQVKAVYLYNFSHFIHWPDTLMLSKNVFNICILGDNPFHNTLEYVVGKEKFKEKPIKVDYFSNVVDVDECQILFISQSEQGQLKTIFEHLQYKPILTVSDMSDFVELGGMIKFYLNRKRQVRLAINPEILREARLQADANLLRISEIVSRK